ncbi:MAG: glucose 1-dehydrogenase [Acidobacteria bacterium]|nr:glucose 1-dehydrogenase [Acidobacteriota bacterium]
MRLEGRVAVITGAGGGIGRACAREFAKEGARMVVADVNFEAARETVSQIERAGGRGLAIETDVSDEASVAALVRQTIEAFGGVDTLVNNAAVFFGGKVEDTTFEQWSRQLAVNIGGVFLCSKAFLPHLRKTRGSIVNLSSVNGFFVEPMCAPYCATKAAIVGLTKGMAIDHGPEGIRVNAICPGYIDAGLAEAYFVVQPDPDAARAAAGKLHALHRIGKPEEIGRAAVFLASADASFITGAAVVVDGGFSAGLPPA